MSALCQRLASIHGMNLSQLVPLMQARLPSLLSVHAFGSRMQGTAGPSSDLD